LITDSVSVALGSSPVTVSFDFEPGLPQIDVDNGQIGRAVQNITVNAVQAMPAGGRVNVAVKTHKLPDSVTDSTLRGKSYVRVRIADQGQGIPPDEIQRVWDPYYSTREGQSGLGLTAAYAIVSKHDGVLHINSQPAKGTVVDMWLPACERSSEDSIDLDQLDPHGSERILVMDDEDFIRSLMDKALSRYGYRVTVAPDGKETLKLYEQAKANSVPFDLVILDLVVANGMGGQETMRELKKLDPSVMALVCSGYSADPIMANYRQHGFAGVVRKPFRPKSLAQAVRHHCDLAKEGRRS
jgi:CheY-like chemotaxis protein